LAGEIRFRTEAQVRERLGRGDVVALRRTLRYRFFRRRHHQLTVATVEHEDVTGFGRNVDDRHLVTVFIGDVGQGRLGRQIHIPQVVVYGLIGPGELTGGGIQRNQGTGVALLLRSTVSAPD